MCVGGWVSDTRVSVSGLGKSNEGDARVVQGWSMREGGG